MSNAYNAMILVNAEKILGHGEDSYCGEAFDNGSGYMAVFDGCGGLGSRKHVEYENKTSAYLSSRTAADVVRQCMQRYVADVSFFNIEPQAVGSMLKDHLAQIFREVKRNYLTSDTTSRIKGSLTLCLPTTASIVAYQADARTLTCYFAWAGDSRGYILTQRGLVQVTKDDVEESIDALSNISSDGKLINIINADKDFTIHCNRMEIGFPCIVMTATDGAFAYLRTPMEFEYMIVGAITRAQSFDDAKHLIEKKLNEFAGDDFTIMLVAFGYRSYAEMRKTFLERRDILEREYVQPLNSAGGKRDELAYELWQRYRIAHEGKIAQ